MVELTRKQREISQRDELILNVSRQLFIEQGYHNVTMDLIAKEVEYSKGTIYQHYASKEEIISALCMRFGKMLLTWFENISQENELPGYIQILMIMESQFVIHEYASADHDLLTLFKSQAFSSKVDEQILHDMNCNVEAIIKIVHKIIRHAEATQELVIQSPATVDSITMGCWAMIEGTFEIADKHAYEKGSFTAKQIKQVLRANCFLFLKGCGWQDIPLNASGALTLTDKDKQNLKHYKTYCRDQIDALNRQNQAVH